MDLQLYKPEIVDIDIVIRQIKHSNICIINIVVNIIPTVHFLCPLTEAAQNELHTLWCFHYAIAHPLQLA